MPRWLRGCAFALLVGSCIVCTGTDERERFAGATIFAGVNSLQVTGDSIFAWSGGKASISRLSAEVGPDGYTLGLHGSLFDEFLGFSTWTRPHEGTFRVVRDPRDLSPRGDGYTALLMLSNDAADLYTSDSGRVDLKKTEGGLDGRYVVYLSSDANSSARKGRHFIVRGTIQLQGKD